MIFFFFIFKIIFTIHVQPTAASKAEDLVAASLAFGLSSDEAEDDVTASIARLTKEQVSLPLAQGHSLSLARSPVRSLVLAHALSLFRSFRVFLCERLCTCACVCVRVCLSSMHACICACMYVHVYVQV